MGSYEYKILAICGSTRKDSSNHRLLKTIKSMTAGMLAVRIYPSIADLPHFNPDLDREGEELPASVLGFRNQLREADGVIICTPEYAHGVPGALKNAIDWTVSSCDFSQRPTILITASTDGKAGHQALLETLRVIEAAHVDQLQLLIPFITTKIDQHGQIRDESTREALVAVIDHLVQILGTEMGED